MNTYKDSLVYLLEDENFDQRLYAIQTIRKNIALHCSPPVIANVRHFLLVLRKRIIEDELEIALEATRLLVDVIPSLEHDLELVLTIILPYLIPILGSAIDINDTMDCDVKTMEINLQIRHAACTVFQTYASFTGNVIAVADILISRGFAHSQDIVREASIDTAMKLVVLEDQQHKSSIDGQLNRTEKELSVTLTQALVPMLDDNNDLVVVAAEHAMAKLKRYWGNGYENTMRQFLSSTDREVFESHQAAIHIVYQELFQLPDQNLFDPGIESPSIQIFDASHSDRPNANCIELIQFGFVPGYLVRDLMMHTSQSNEDWKKRSQSVEQLLHSTMQANSSAIIEHINELDNLFEILIRLIQDIDGLLVKRAIQILQIIFEKLSSVNNLSIASSMTHHQAECSNLVAKILPHLIETAVNFVDDTSLESIIYLVFKSCFERNLIGIKQASQSLLPTMKHRRLNIRDMALKIWMLLLLYLNKQSSDISTDFASIFNETTGIVDALGHSLGDSSTKVRETAMQTAVVIQAVTKVNVCECLRAYCEEFTLDRIDMKKLKIQTNDDQLNLPRILENGKLAFVSELPDLSKKSVSTSCDFSNELRHKTPSKSPKVYPLKSSEETSPIPNVDQLKDKETIFSPLFQNVQDGYLSSKSTKETAPPVKPLRCIKYSAASLDDRSCLVHGSVEPSEVQKYPENISLYNCEGIDQPSKTAFRRGNLRTSRGEEYASTGLRNEYPNTQSCRSVESDFSKPFVVHQFSAAPSSAPPCINTEYTLTTAHKTAEHREENFRSNIHLRELAVNNTSPVNNGIHLVDSSNHGEALSSQENKVISIKYHKLNNSPSVKNLEDHSFTSIHNTLSTHQCNKFTDNLSQLSPFGEKQRGNVAEVTSGDRILTKDKSAQSNSVQNTPTEITVTANTTELNNNEYAFPMPNGEYSDTNTVVRPVSLATRKRMEARRRINEQFDGATKDTIKSPSSNDHAHSTSKSNRGVNKQRSPKKSDTDTPRTNADPKYIDYEMLQPVVNPQQALTSSLRQLNSDDWESIFDGLATMQRLAKHNTVLIIDRVHELVNLILPQACNLRSAVSKNAILALESMCHSLGSSMDSEIECMLATLLKRCSDTNAFVNDAAIQAIASIVTNCSTYRVTTALISHTSNKNSAIRREAARGLQIIVINRIFTGTAIKDLPRIVGCLGRCLSDSNKEVREVAKQGILYLLHERHNSQDSIKEMIPKECHSKLAKLFDGTVKYIPLGQIVTGKVPANNQQQAKGSDKGKVNSSKKNNHLASMEERKENVASGKRDENANLQNKSKLKNLDSDVIASLETKLDSGNWKDRFESLIEVTDLFESCSQQFCENSRILPLFDLLIKRMEDGNAKVHIKALECMLRIIPSMGSNSTVILANFLPSIAKNLASNNSKTTKLAHQVLKLLCENADKKLLCQQLSALIKHSNSRVKPQLIDSTEYLVSLSRDEKYHSTLLKYVVSVAFDLMRDAKYEVKIANEKLLVTLYGILGTSMVQSVYKLSTPLQNRLTVILGISSLP